MHVAVLENRFGDHRGAVGDAVHRHELRLHVRRERRIGRRSQTHAVIRSAHGKLDEITAAFDFRVRFFELVEHGFENVAARIGRDDFTAGGGRSDQKRAGLDAIRHDAVGRADQPAHTLNRNYVGAMAFDFRAHGDQAISEIDDFRLARGILQRGHAVRQGRRHH